MGNHGVIVAAETVAEGRGTHTISIVDFVALSESSPVSMLFILYERHAKTGATMRLEPQSSTTSSAVSPRGTPWSRYAARWWCPHRPIHRVEFAGGPQECLRCGEIVEGVHSLMSAGHDAMQW